MFITKLGCWGVVSFFVSCLVFLSSKTESKRGWTHDTMPLEKPFAMNFVPAHLRHLKRCRIQARKQEEYFAPLRKMGESPSDHIRACVRAMNDFVLDQYLELRGMVVKPDRSKLEPLRNLKETALVEQLIKDYSKEGEPDIEGRPINASPKLALSLMGIEIEEPNATPMWRPSFPRDQRRLSSDGLTKSFQTITLRGECTESGVEIPLSIPKRRFFATAGAAKSRRSPKCLETHPFGSGHPSSMPSRSHIPDSYNKGVDRFDIYVTYPRTFDADGPIRPHHGPSVAVILIPDELGFAHDNVQQFADILAFLCRLTVVVPDLYNGRGWAHLAPEEEPEKVMLGQWKAQFCKDVQAQIIDTAVGWLQSRAIFQSVSFCGLGTGAGAALTAAVRINECLRQGGMKRSDESLSGILHQFAASGSSFTPNKSTQRILKPVTACVAVNPCDYDITSVSSQLRCPVACVFGESDGHPETSNQSIEHLKSGLLRNRDVKHHIIDTFRGSHRFLHCQNHQDSGDALALITSFLDIWGY
eukprot:GHVN01057367.1.p1 GENE.GHVN01057367.1~~GHVN01057367.1.p1  ORF type:complete len:529 (-),score=48.89 GHVN01057367.1:1840-3426(-)